MVEEIVLPGVVLVNVGVEKDLEKPLEELSLLAKTAGYEVRAILTQHKEHPDKAYYLGTGKLSELKSVAEATESEVVVFDNELSGTQLNNLEEELGVTVMDRATLIIEIFARHATSNEGKLQVELMRKRKMLPRVLGQGLMLSRQGGGGGGGMGARRGGGEQQQELDKRTIRAEIRDLEERIEKLSKERALRREKHLKNKVKTVSLVGYTNAGKSTLMNAMTKAGVLEENKLFATLDPISRKMWLGLGREFLLVDTVGFISKLPHEFVRAFRSTLEETKYSDLILHVVDGANPEATMQFDVVNEVLKSIGVENTPILVVINKMDAERDESVPLPASENVVMISAKTGMGIELLKDKISEMLFGNKGDNYESFNYKW